MINCTDAAISKQTNENMYVTVTLFIDNYATNFATEITDFVNISGFPSEALTANPKYDCGSVLYDIATGDVYMSNGSDNVTGWIKQ